VEHLKACIEKHYQISCDWTGSAYCGLKLDWDYENNIVDVSMPGYIKAALNKFQHPDPTSPENAPHTWNPPVYGSKTQFIEAQEDDHLLPPKGVTKIQQSTGTLL
jgi:endonuclease I